MTGLKTLLTGVTQLVGDDNKDTASYFHHLPEKLLVAIFSQLSTTDLLNNVALVSKKFYWLTKNPLVHINIDILMSNVDHKEQVARFLGNAVHLRHLVVEHPQLLYLLENEGLHKPVYRPFWKKNLGYKSTKRVIQNSQNG
jgi:hypothetical protein